MVCHETAALIFSLILSPLPNPFARHIEVASKAEFAKRNGSKGAPTPLPPTISIAMEKSTDPTLARRRSSQHFSEGTRRAIEELAGACWGKWRGGDFGAGVLIVEHF